MIASHETVRRHQTKLNKNDFGETEMREWYREKDFLDCIKEITIPERNVLEETVEYILSHIQ